MFMFFATLVVVLLSIFGLTQSWATADTIVHTGPPVPIFELPSSPFLTTSGQHPSPRRINETESVQRNFMDERQETYSEHDDNNVIETATVTTSFENTQMPSETEIEDKLQNAVTESVWLSTIEADSKQLVKELMNQHIEVINSSRKLIPTHIPVPMKKKESEKKTPQEGGELEQKS